VEISRHDNCDVRHAGATARVGLSTSQNAQIQMTLPTKTRPIGSLNQLPGGALAPEPFEKGGAGGDADVVMTLGLAFDV
jgi:hypothetical protein